MGLFEVAYSSVRGNLHSLRALPNQDAIDIREVNKTLIVSIADGHGSQTCFRSDLGSKMAVETANVLIADRILNQNIAFMDGDEEARALCQEISSLWTKTVLHHLGKNAFEDDEVKDLNSFRQRDLGKNALLAYGTTLMTLVITSTQVVVLNIGDAELLVKYKNADEPEIVNRNKRVGNETESLALKDAHDYYVVKRFETDQLEALLAATDGYPNSFKQDSGYSKVIHDLIHIQKEHGIEAIQNNLSDWLEDTSVNGSGDDITACFVACVSSAL